MRASEDRLDVFLLLPDGDAFELVNDPAGIGALVERLDEEPPEVVAPKTTGGYEHPAPAAVVAAGLAGAVVDPRRARATVLLDREPGPPGSGHGF